MRYEITPRFTVGEDVSLALHADHPEDGRPQLLRVAWIVVEIQARATLISYFLRLRGLRAWSHEQEFLIGEKTRAGYVLCAEEELVPWAEAEAAYKTQQGDGTPERTP